jgi:hypothetical protein
MEIGRGGCHERVPANIVAAAVGDLSGRRPGPGEMLLPGGETSPDPAGPGSDPAATAES